MFVESGFGSSGAGFGIGEANRQVVDHPNIVTQLPAIGCSTAGPVAANLQDLVFGDGPPLHTITPCVFLGTWELAGQHPVTDRVAMHTEDLSGL